MATITEQEKLRALLPHWIEHNTEHASVFRRWAELAGPAQADLDAAADQLEAANGALAAAVVKLDKLG